MKKLSVLLGAILILILASPAFAVPVQWTSAAGGNDHIYDVILGNMSWDAAAADAQADGYYLATITSAAEQAFIANLLGVPPADVIVEYWVGGFQVLPGSTEQWRWVNNEGDFWANGAISGVYSNWGNGEPNNNPAPEDHLALDNRYNWGWNDNDFSQYAIVGYIAERGAPVPEPATMLLLGSGLIGLVGIGRKKFMK